MITVVEGPSAAGKTSWIARHCDPATVVAEATAAETEDAPNQSRLEESARFWTTLNSTRWVQAQRIEQALGVAVCDSDPFKLHYTWTLWRSGHAPREQWVAALEANRQAFGSGALGVADLILVTIPDADTLTHRRRLDLSRRRHNFDIHTQLAEPPAEWYHAVERLDPSRVIWQLPPDGVPANLSRRDPNSGTQLLDALLAHLPER